MPLSFQQCLLWSLFIVLLFLPFSTEARQYKSRLFTDSDQALSEAGAKTVAELEDAFQTFDDDYQIATAGQFLARQFVANKEYEKAVLYYEKALAAETLSPLIQRELQLEYAGLLLHLKRYQRVLTLLLNAELKTEERILLAKANNGASQFHRAIEFIAPLMTQLHELSESTLKQMAEISYQADALNQTIAILQALLTKSPRDLDLARQITGLYLRQQDFQAALALWSLTAQQGLLTEEQDLSLLADIYFQQGAPEKAARTLQESLENNLMAQNAENYYRLFQFWYAARESEPAQQSLWRSLQITPDLDKAMMLAELLRQSERWAELLRLLEYGCQSVLPDSYVGKANLLLCISYHKLQRHNDARRALLNASLISGVREQAREWLAFIEAKPATMEESSTLDGLCLPADTHISLPKNAVQKISPSKPQKNTAQTSPKSDSARDFLEVITLPATKFYGNKIQTAPELMATTLKKQTFSLIKNLLKSGGKIDGKMHLLFEQLQRGNELNFVVAFPYGGVPANRGRSRIIREPARSIVERHFNGQATELAAQWQQLVFQATAQGLIPTGRARMMFLSDTSGTDTLDVSLQLEINTP